MAKLGTSRNPGEARALPPTLQMKIGRALQSYLSELRNVFPEVNPVGEAIEDFFLEPSEQMTADMAAGNPYAVIDPRPNTRNINPAVVDTAALLPVASVAKIAATPAAAATATGMGLLGLQMGGLGARRGLLGAPTSRFAGPGRSQRGAVGPLRDYDVENNLIGEDDGLLSNIESSIAPIKLPRGRGKDLSEAKRELKAAELELKNWRSMTPNEQQKYAKERGQKLSRADNSIKDRAKQARKNVNALENMRETKSTVPGAKRVGYPGVYKKPSQLAAESEARVAPENPAMQRLFGVNRDDLFEMNKTRVGPQSQLLKRPASGRVPTSEATDAVMSPENTARLLENIDVAKKEAPGLTKGMLPWYLMDPVFERQVELLGYDEAVRLFNQMQSMTGMTSPNSGVAMEIARGLGANYLYEKNRLDDFIKYGGIAEKNRNRVSDFPPDMMDIPGHMTHSTAHAKPMKKFLDAGGVVDMDSVKVPSYIEAAGVPGHPNIPFQTRTPVGDAHFARGIGLADARAGGDWGKSITSPELRAIEDWWYTDIAQPSGIEGVPAQALSWGLYAPQTGVKTDIGAGKLELLSEHIMRRAKQTGVTPEEMRDLILSGKAYGIGATGLLGGLLSESLYQPETSM